MTPINLKAWRAAQHVNQEQLAAKLGVHEITVSRWERGQTPIPSFLHLALWALAHNAPPEPLLDGQGEPTTRYAAKVRSLKARGLI